jgi:hypothetical protein
LSSVDKDRIASAAGELKYLDGGCNGLCTEVASDSFLGEIHLGIVFGFAIVSCSSSCSLCPSFASDMADAFPNAIFFKTDDTALSRI